MDLNSTKELISEIKRGNMVLLMDDEDRENEGDVILAGEKVTANKINFMARHARGLICLATVSYTHLTLPTTPYV